MNRRIAFLNSFGLLASALPMAALMKLSKKYIVLPFYHCVTDEKVPHISNLYQVRNQKMFKEDIEFLMRHYKPVSIEDLYKIVVGEDQVKEPVFHLTFDDGLKENYTTIAPLLRSMGVPATFFVNTGFIDNKDLFYRYKCSLILEALKPKIMSKDFAAQTGTILGKEIISCDLLKSEILRLGYADLQKINLLGKLLEVDFKEFLQSEKPYLERVQIESLLKDGFSIGAHSIDHPAFKAISTEEQKRQISGSMEEIKKYFPEDHSYFSFPFSDEGVSNEVFEWLFRDQKCALSFGISGMKTDAYRRHLHRIPMEGNSLPGSRILKSEYLYYLSKIPFNKNKINRNDQINL